MNLPTHADPAELLSRALAFTGAAQILWAYRTIGEDRTWQLFLRDEEMPDEFAAGQIPIENVPALFLPEGSLRVQPEPASVAKRFHDLMKVALPLSIRGDFVPCEPAIQIGWHDIYDNSDEPPYGRLIARAFFSFKLFGYGTPSNWKEYRRLVFDIPAVKQLKADLEAIVGGPMEQVVYWSV